MAIQVTDLHLLRDQLLLRRQKIQNVVSRAQTANLLQLWNRWIKLWNGLTPALTVSVKSAMKIWERNEYSPIRLARMCLDCLPPAEARALERDLELAATIQTGLLPPRRLCCIGLESCISLRTRRYGQW